MGKQYSRDFIIELTAERYANIRPQYAVEMVSSDIPEQSSLEGILRSVLWHNAIEWRVHKVYVMNEIVHDIMRENGVATIESGQKCSRDNGEGSLSPSDNRIMRFRRILRKVRYIMVATVEYDSSNANPTDSLEKFCEMATRRLKKGQSFDYVSGGQRPFLAELKFLHEIPQEKSFYYGRQIDFGLGRDRNGNPARRIMCNGIINFCEPERVDPVMPVEKRYDLITSLNDAYDSFLGKGYVDDPVMAKERIRFFLEIGKGKIPVLRYASDDHKGVLMTVPAKRVRSSEVMPNFCWHNAAYVLGICPEGKSAEWTATRKKAFDQFHLQVMKNAEGDIAESIREMLHNHLLPEVPAAMEKDLAQGSIALTYNGTPIWEDPEIAGLWRKLKNEEKNDSEKIICSISGKEDVLEMVHPKIKGLWGGSTMGSPLVCVNVDCASYMGRRQGAVAGIGKETAGRYAAVLNYLLSDPDSKTRIGDTTVIAFTEDADLDCSHEVIHILSECSWDDSAAERFSGKMVHISGLKPSGSRIFVAFDIDISFSDFYLKMKAYSESMQIGDKPLPLWKLLSVIFEKNAGVGFVAASIESVLGGKPFPVGIKAFCRAKVAEMPEKWWFHNIYTNMVNMEKENEKKGEEDTFKVDNDTKTMCIELGRLFHLCDTIDRISRKSRKGSGISLYEKRFKVFRNNPAYYMSDLTEQALKQAAKLGGKWEERVYEQLQLIFAMPVDVPQCLKPVFHIYVLQGYSMDARRYDNTEVEVSDDTFSAEL